MGKEGKEGRRKGKEERGRRKAGGKAEGGSTHLVDG
jgi:hypothetical protein